MKTYYAESTFLPFALLALITLLPPTVSIRDLNPCLLFLTKLLGWYVRFILRLRKIIDLELIQQLRYVVNKNHSINSDAKPKNTKNPRKSVRNVKNTPEDIAGSNPILSIVIGTIAPQKPAKIKFSVTERAKTMHTS